MYPISRGMDKEDGVHILEHSTCIKENEIMSSAATWMDLENIILREVSQREKDKSHVASSAYLWNLKYGADAPTCKPEKDSHIRGPDVCL